MKILASLPSAKERAGEWIFLFFTFLFSGLPYCALLELILELGRKRIRDPKVKHWSVHC